MRPNKPIHFPARRRQFPALRSARCPTEHEWQRPLAFEPLETRRMLASDLFANPAAGMDSDVQNLTAEVHGLKWEDLDGNGHFDTGEMGLGGVTIYSDLNRNTRLDTGEPSTVTMHEDPVTDFDEGGRYHLSGLSTGNHVIREVVPDGFKPTFPRGGARVIDSETARYGPGVAIDFDVTGASIASSSSSAGTTVNLELTVVWPDSCGSILPDRTSHTVVGDHLLVQMFAKQVGEICAEVISPESQTIHVEGLEGHRFEVIGSLNESLDKGSFTPTLALVGNITIESAGTHTVELQAGEVVNGIDFGNQPVTTEPASIHGIKWADHNGDGKRNKDEPGIPGVTIYLDVNHNAQLDDDEPHTVTMQDDTSTGVARQGRYQFPDVEPGFYIAREVVPQGFEQTFPDPFLCAALFCSGRGHMVNVTPGQTIKDIDFGNRPLEVNPGSVEGVKWLDANGNRERDRGESSLAGIVIFADLNFNGVPDKSEPQTKTWEDDPTTSRDESGQYRLTGLQPGSHWIFEVLPTGSEQTFPLAFMPLAGAPDLEPFPGVPGGHHVLIKSGEVVKGINFGNRPIRPGSIHGVKWLDGDGNGKRNSNEPGLSGVVVYSDLNYDGQHNTGEPLARTREDDPQTPVDETGQYVLDELANGLHVIREIVPEGFQQTFPRPQNILEPAAIDILPPSDGSHMVYVHSGTVIRGINFGNQPLQTETGSIQGTKWNDRNGNGRRDQDEPGLPGVTIYLDTNFNGQLDDDEPRTVTIQDDTNTVIDQLGHYRFPEVESGFYIVREVVPRGYEQTLPEIFLCKAHFCIGRGHMVNITPGQTVKNIDFGNQPVSAQLGSIHGQKWLDRNGNGQLEAGEPRLPGVRIYIDLNNNGRPDRNEPRTVTRRDNPRTDFNEGGRYRFDNLVAGEYVVREIVPNGFTQTFPVSGAEILQNKTTQLRPGPAIDYQLIDVTQTADAAGLSLSFTVVWRDGCGSLLTNQTSASVDNQQIHIEMFGHRTDNFCVQALIPRTYTVNLGPLTSGTYDLKAMLNNVTLAGNFDASFLVEGEISIGGDGAHTVQLEPGEVVDDIHFGNRHRRFIAGVPIVIWDGDTAVGTTGDGQSWSDTNNWSRDGVVDFELVPAVDLPHIFFLPAQTVGNITLDNHQTIASLHFMENYTLEGAGLTVTSGEVSVAAGVTAILNSRLESTVGITKTGEGEIIVDAAVGDVTVTQGTWGGSQVTGNLHVQAGAILSPGQAVLIADDSLLAIQLGDLDLDTEYDGTISSATMPSPTSDIHGSGTTDPTETMPTSHPSGPTTAAPSGSGDRNENDATVLLDLILGLDDLDL